MTTQAKLNELSAIEAGREQNELPGECLRVGTFTLAILLNGVVAAKTGQTFFSPFDMTQNTFPRLIGFLALVLFYAGTCRFISSIHCRRTTKRWWNVGDLPDDPSWEDVKNMTLGELDFDPIKYRNEDRNTSSVWEFSILLIAFMSTNSLAIVGINILTKDQVLPFLFSDPKSDISLTNEAGLILNLSGNLTAFLALIAAFISIYFTHRQLQAKVKADSRQAWIEKLRGNIACFVALADAAFQYPCRDRTKLTTCRMEMELMLNPSEKDHRLLMYLTIKLAFFHWKNSDFERVQDVENILETLKPHRKNNAEQWDKILSPIPAIYDQNRERQFSDLIGYTLRLSHVVLKREWERVKATR